MPGFLEQLGALVSAGDRNLRKLKEEEWLRANPGKPLPTGTGMVAQKEGMLQRGIRRGSEILADTFTTPGTAANQQFEGGFQAILNMVSPVDSSTGMPNVDKAGLVLSATNMPKIRKSMEEFLAQNPDLVTVYPEAAKAMAYARAKYPKLSSIADISFTERKLPTAGMGSRSVVRGEYAAADNKAVIATHPDADTMIDTIMHESFHARQAMRDRPDYINDKNKYLLRASKFNEKVDAQNEAALREYVRVFNENADKPMSVRRDMASTAKFNYYRHANPLEVPAFKAGDTAAQTYWQFENALDMQGQQVPGSERTLASGIAEAVGKARLTFGQILDVIKGRE